MPKHFPKEDLKKIKNACKLGEIDIVKNFFNNISDTIDVSDTEWNIISNNIPYIYYDKFLYNACCYQHEDIVKFLIAEGVSPNISRGNPLGIALCNNNESMAITLIKAGADVNYSFPIIKGGWEEIDNFTFLMSAAERNLTKVVKLLIHKGLDIEAKTTDDLTPLCYAILHHAKDATKLLVMYGANLKPTFTSSRYYDKTIVDLPCGTDKEFEKFLKIVIAARYDDFSYLKSPPCKWPIYLNSLWEFFKWKISIKPEDIDNDTQLFKMHLQDLSNFKKNLEALDLANLLPMQDLDNVLNNYKDISNLDLAGKINEVEADTLTYD